MEGVELNKKYTYAQMCEIFGSEQKKGTCSRNSQLKEWEAMCKIDKPCKGKYVILEIYEEQKEIVDNRRNNGNLKYYTQLKVPKEDWHKSGVYKIQFENKVYIGSTKNFRNRYKKHLKKDKKELPHVWELLKKDSCTFEVLEIIEDKEKLLTKEQYYLDLYLNNNDFIVVNKQRAVKKEVEPIKHIKVYSRDYEKIAEFCRNNNIEML